MKSIFDNVTDRHEGQYAIFIELIAESHEYSGIVVYSVPIDYGYPECLCDDNRGRFTDASNYVIRTNFLSGPRQKVGRHNTTTLSSLSLSNASM